MILKVSVLASGAISLDGQPIELTQLDAALEAAKKDIGQIWYYREAAGEEPHPHAMEVMQLVVKHKLPIRLSTKPDFSDSVGAQGSIDSVFEGIRKVAAGGSGQRGLVIVRPDGGYFLLPPPPETPQLKQAAARLDGLVPSSVKRNIAVIADTSFAKMGPGGSPPNPMESNKAIPFFGMLVGLSYAGHSVWIFGAHAMLLAAGCRDADMLIVDSAVLGSLPVDWPAQAAAVMRNGNIAIHDREKFQLGFIRNAGGTPGPAVFPN